MEKRKINRRLLPVKVHYFLFFAALGCALPFRTVLAKRLGISATAIGVIFCAVPFMKIITNPLFGFLLDYFKRFRLILSIIMITVTVSHVAIIFIPPKSLMLQDTMNAIRKDFHSELTYLRANDSIQSSCHPKLTLNMEFILSQKPVKQSNSFICDIQCSKSKIYHPINSLENKPQCHMEMNSEFQIFIHISDCDISIELGKGQLAIFHPGAQHLMLFEVKNALTRKIATSIPPSKNCSLEQTKFMPLSSKNIQNSKKKLSNIKDSKVDTEDSLKFSVENINNEIVENSAGIVKKYYLQNEYVINLYNKKLCMNFCSQEFDCQAKKCSLRDDIKNSSLVRYTDEENDFLSEQFWYFFVLMIIACSALSAIIFLMDAVTYELLQERKYKYGEQRLWGTIGWGVGALIGGCLNQIATTDSEEINYAPSFYMLGFLVLTDLIPIYHLKVTDIKYSSNICRDVRFLLTKIDLLYNVIVVFFIGVLSGFIWNYQFWFMEEIGSSQVLLGLSQTFDCIFELPCFILSGWIIMKIGHNHCNSVALFCFGLRYLCFAIMYDPWWTLAVALLNGPTFGLFYASMTMYAKNEAPEGTEATVQSLFHLCFEGIGVATGSLLGGIGLDKFGSRTSFVYAASMSFILLFVNIFVSFYLSKAKRDDKRNSSFVLKECILKY